MMHVFKNVVHSTKTACHSDKYKYVGEGDKRKTFGKMCGAKSKGKNFLCQLLNYSAHHSKKISSLFSVLCSVYFADSI